MTIVPDGPDNDLTEQKVLFKGIKKDSLIYLLGLINNVSFQLTHHYGVVDYGYFLVDLVAARPGS